MYQLPHPPPLPNTLNSGVRVVDPHVEPLRVEGGQAAHAGGGRLVGPALRFDGARHGPQVDACPLGATPLCAASHALVDEQRVAVFVGQAEGSILSLYLRWLGGGQGGGDFGGGGRGGGAGGASGHGDRGPKAWAC